LGRAPRRGKGGGARLRSTPRSPARVTPPDPSPLTAQAFWETISGDTEGAQSVPRGKRPGKLLATHPRQRWVIARSRNDAQIGVTGGPAFITALRRQLMGWATDERVGHDFRGGLAQGFLRRKRSLSSACFARGVELGLEADDHAGVTASRNGGRRASAPLAVTPPFPGRTSRARASRVQINRPQAVGPWPPARARGRIPEGGSGSPPKGVTTTNDRHRCEACGASFYHAGFSTRWVLCRPCYERNRVLRQLLEPLRRRLLIAPPGVPPFGEGPSEG